MIKVQFKNNYENIYSGKEYTYKDYEGAEVGDIVVVNTNCGYAIARVSQVNVINYDINIDMLSTVEKIIITQKEIEERAKVKYERIKQLKEIAKAARRKALIDNLTDYISTEELSKIKDLTEEELIKIQKFMML